MRFSNEVSGTSVARVVEDPGVAYIAHYQDEDTVRSYPLVANNTYPQLRALINNKTYHTSADVFSAVVAQISASTREEPEVFESTSDELWVEVKSALGIVTTEILPTFYVYWTDGPENVLGVFRAFGEVGLPEFREGNDWVEKGITASTDILSAYGVQNRAVDVAAVWFYDANPDETDISKYKTFFI